MKDDVLHSEKRNRKIGFYTSIGLHATLLLLFLIPFVRMIKFPPEESGIMVMFGEEKAGQSEDTYVPEETVSKPSAASTSKNTQAATETKTKEEVSDVVVEDKKKSKADNKNQSADKNKSVAEAAEKQKAEREKLEREAREREAAEKKKKISDLFGKGKGDGSKPGNQGKPDGEPDGKVLEGITKGSGRVGGGLSSRGLVFEPSFQDNSQRSGKVVITICVDKSGKVISTKFTQKGSTTSDPYLIQITEKAAARYKFTPGEIDSQCGTITVDYRVQ